MRRRPIREIAGVIRSVDTSFGPDNGINTNVSRPRRYFLHESVSLSLSLSLPLSLSPSRVWGCIACAVHGFLFRRVYKGTRFAVAYPHVCVMGRRYAPRVDFSLDFFPFLIPEVE